ncbi:MAG: M20/M25/M40 family metallo-hydrolase [Candidatus Margulisbacteria bacterium]|nr:M20/M25/M40 family metallo-hydrolase [Candidatus Margulisiibacteriota bacterium]
MVNSKRLVKTFIDLVKIDSESGNEKKVSKYLQKILCDLGLDVALDKKGNIYAISHGKLSGPSLLFSAHMDTVTPGNGIEPVIKGDRISSRGDTILGGDDKSGIAEILEMLYVIKEKKLDTTSIVVIFSVEEEIGLKGAKALQPIQVDYGFVLDTGGEIGTVIVKAPNHYSFEAKVIGRSAHAGMEPEKGINAIVVASKAISKCKIGRIDEETVANIGMIEGGKATNIVPDEVIVKGEARSQSKKKVKNMVKDIQLSFKKACKKAGADLEFIARKDYGYFDVSKEKELLKVCKKAAQSLGVQHVEQASGGGSDANIFNKMGIPTVVLSTGMNKVHTCEEEIKISDMVTATEYILSIVKKIKD